jgi:hypothetical protein
MDSNIYHEPEEAYFRFLERQGLTLASRTKLVPESQHCIAFNMKKLGDVPGAEPLHACLAHLPA